MNNLEQILKMYSFLIALFKDLNSKFTFEKLLRAISEVVVCVEKFSSIINKLSAKEKLYLALDVLMTFLRLPSWLPIPAWLLKELLKIAINKIVDLLNVRYGHIWDITQAVYVASGFKYSLLRFLNIIPLK